LYKGAQKYTPSWIKVKYGAWYLNPKAWKSRQEDEPLQDPREQQDKTLSEAKKKSQKLVSLDTVFVDAGHFNETLCPLRVSNLVK
jgi:hypothetical protein